MGTATAILRLHVMVGDTGLVIYRAFLTDPSTSCNKGSREGNTNTGFRLTDTGSLKTLAKTSRPSITTPHADGGLRTADTDGNGRTTVAELRLCRSLRAHNSDAALIRRILCINAPPREHLPQTLLSRSEIAGCFLTQHITWFVCTRSGSCEQSQHNIE